jgi:hypothetical protein
LQTKSSLDLVPLNLVKQEKSLLDLVPANLVVKIVKMLPTVLMEANITNMDEAINHDVPTISGMIRDHSPAFTRSLLMVWIWRLNQEVKGPTMSDSQMRTCAMRIMQKHTSLKLSDLTLVWNKVIDGEIKLYGGLATSDIIELLDNHLTDRGLYSADKNLSKHYEFNQDITDVAGTDRKSFSRQKQQEQTQNAISHLNIEKAKTNLK